MKRAVAAVVVLLVSGWSSGCGLGCSPAGPSGQAVSFAGTISGGGLVYHDVTVPSNTDSVNVSVQWTPAAAQVRLTQIDPNCNPTQRPSCQKLTDPQGNSSQSPGVVSAARADRIRPVTRADGAGLQDGVASPMPASWNQIVAWLRQIDGLRAA